MPSCLERLMTNRVRAWDLLKHSALEEELERLHPASFAWAMACCRWSRPDAEEVLQAAYFKVLSAQAVYGGRATVKTWLFGVIRNTAADHRRRRLLEAMLVHRWFVRREAPAIAPAADELLGGEEGGEGVVDGVRGLGGRQGGGLGLGFF